MTVINKGLWLSRLPGLNPYDLVYSTNPCTEGDMKIKKKLLRIYCVHQTNCRCAVTMFVRCPACL